MNAGDCQDHTASDATIEPTEGVAEAVVVAVYACSSNSVVRMQ